MKRILLPICYVGALCACVFPAFAATVNVTGTGAWEALTTGSVTSGNVVNAYNLNASLSSAAASSTLSVGTANGAASLSVLNGGNYAVTGNLFVGNNSAGNAAVLSIHAGGLVNVSAVTGIGQANVQSASLYILGGKLQTNGLNMTAGTSATTVSSLLVVDGGTASISGNVNLATGNNPASVMNARIDLRSGTFSVVGNVSFGSANIGSAAGYDVELRVSSAMTLAYLDSTATNFYGASKLTLVAASGTDWGTKGAILSMRSLRFTEDAVVTLDLSSFDWNGAAGQSIDLTVLSYVGLFLAGTTNPIDFDPVLNITGLDTGKYRIDDIFWDLSAGGTPANPKYLTVSVTALGIPEPSAVAAVLGLSALLSVLRRRR